MSEEHTKYGEVLKMCGVESISEGNDAELRRLRKRVEVLERRWEIFFESADNAFGADEEARNVIVGLREFIEDRIK